MSKKSLDTVQKFLRGDAFIVLTHNSASVPASRYEAWAYKGVLNFDRASSVRFGLGPDPVSAMAELDRQLEAIVVTDETSVKLEISRRELATILAALRYHQDENLQGGGDLVDNVVGDIASDGGTWEPLNAAEVDDLCARLNLGPRPRKGKQHGKQKRHRSNCRAARATPSQG